jgi:uncharacterized protein related to proFAR isomerase
MSTEETLVRNAYAKFAFATDLDVITQSALQMQGMRAVAHQNSKVTFRLSDLDANGRNMAMPEDSNVDSTALATVLSIDSKPVA